MLYFNSNICYIILFRIDKEIHTDDLLTFNTHTERKHPVNRRMICHEEILNYLSYCTV